MSQLLKFSLSVQTNTVDHVVSYSVTPGNRAWIKDGIDWYEWEYDPTKMLVVKVSLDKPIDSKSYIVISNLAVDGVVIDQLDQTGTYVRSDSLQVVSDAYGFMNWPGTYTFKIRYAPVIHNYVTYLKKLARPCLTR
jgi:hypothetical protein